MNIAISSVGTATSIGLIKCIKKYNNEIKIIGTDVNEYGYTAGSILVDKFYKVSQYNNDEYIEQLLKIFDLEKIDMFIPVHDYEIIKIAEYMDLFKNYKIIIPSLEILNIFSDKLKATLAMSNIGVLVPKIVDVDYNGKKILRKKTSVGSKGIRVINENERLNLEDSEFLQEFINGDEYTVDIFSDKHGDPIVIIPRLRLEIKAGVATKIKLVYEKKLIEICERILRHYRIPGLSNIQFIKQDMNYYFIELNPRFGGASISSIIGGYNYIGDFLNFDNIIGGHDILEKNLKRIKWNCIITRYYEEVVYYEK